MIEVLLNKIKLKYVVQNDCIRKLCLTIVIAGNDLKEEVGTYF